MRKIRSNYVHESLLCGKSAHVMFMKVYYAENLFILSSWKSIMRKICSYYIHGSLLCGIIFMEVYYAENLFVLCYVHGSLLCGIIFMEVYNADNLFILCYVHGSLLCGQSVHIMFMEVCYAAFCSHCLFSLIFVVYIYFRYD